MQRIEIKSQGYPDRKKLVELELEIMIFLKEQFSTYLILVLFLCRYSVLIASNTS